MAGAFTQPQGSVERDETLSDWLRAAMNAAARLGADKDERMMKWADGLIERGLTPKQAIERLRELPRVLFDDDSVEVLHLATLAALLRGMWAATGSATHRTVVNSVSRLVGESHTLIVIANAAADFVGRLPFQEAINGLAKRVGLIKWSESDRQFQEQPAFMDLDAANRSRAFTMARIEDLEHVDQVHEELVKTIAAGESLYDWRMKHVKEIAEGGYRSTGWEGSPLGEWHYQLVYHQNLSMAYTAGRYESGTRSGFKVVRILPTLSMEPREEHSIYANQAFRIDSDSPLPPWDFGCNCGWEWVFPEELDGVDLGKLPLLRFDDSRQQFKFRPAAYMAVDVDPGQYSGPVADIARDMRESQ